MATVTAGQKFLGVASTVDTTEKKSADINAKTEYFTIEDIQDLTTVDVTAASLALAALGTAPASATATGTLGQIVIDANYIYVCVATNTWKRVAIATWS
tara:strand:- start:233 stop:529 length:297 start_codon:yes stop_codon:yes gene_type:complete